MLHWINHAVMQVAGEYNIHQAKGKEEEQGMKGFSRRGEDLPRVAPSLASASVKSGALQDPLITLVLINCGAKARKLTNESGRTLHK